MHRIPVSNLRYPVLVQLSSGAGGTGFYVTTPTAVFFVTAKHVLFEDGKSSPLAPTATLRSFPIDPKDQSQVILEIDLAAMASTGALRQHPTRDIAVAKIGDTLASKDTTFQFKFAAAVTSRNYPVSGLVSVDRQHLLMFDDVCESNEVLVFGYPTSLGIPTQPQFDITRPLLRGGIVAGLDRAARTIVLDCAVYPGNSGGPVVEISQEPPVTFFRPIGVVSQFVPLVEHFVNDLFGYRNTSMSNSGYSIAVPLDYVTEMIDKW
jgi:hypothetical protein